ELSLEQLQKILDESFWLTAEKAVLAGLVDKVAHYDQVIDRLNEIGEVEEETGEFAQVTLDDYVDRPRTMSDVMALEDDDRPAVSVVYLEGAILDGWGDDGVFVGGDEIADRLRDIRQDDKTEVVVLRVNSPGGSVTGAEAVRREVERVREDGIPVVISMGTVAASGGYWVATRSDRIFARPETITGSIGVFGLLPNVKELGNRFGLTWDVVKTEPHADAFSFVRPRSEEEMQDIQVFVDNIYDRFLDHVAAGRDMNKTAVNDVARGRVWSGRDAREIGLVDEFGGLGDAIRYAVELADLPEDFQVIEHPRAETPFELLAEMLDEPVIRETLSGTVTRRSSAARFLHDLENRFGMLARLNDPRNAYALLPWLWDGVR
ncbi:MAG: signal peptide peptidase SppA, partial [Opitutales bacterium]